MSNNTIITQGSFVSTGGAQTLSIRSGFDWIWTYNETVLNGALGTTRGAQFFWRVGMPVGYGIEYQLQGAQALSPLTTLGCAANAGFFPINSVINVPTAPIAEAGITNVTQPVVTTGNTAALVTGSIVRLLADAGAPNLMGFDWEVGTVVANTSFKFRWVLANAPGAVGTGGDWVQIPYNPLFYPPWRYIINITQAASAVVTTSVTHGYNIGNEVRFNVPPQWGMTQINGMYGTITAINTATNTFTVNINTSGFDAFVFPPNAAYPFTFAQVVPFGENTGQALMSGVDILTDAVYNTGIIGVTLAAGTDSPAGLVGETISWQAFKVFSTNS